MSAAASITVAPFVSILTKRLASGRYKASTECGRSITIGNDGSGGQERHVAAALALCEHLGWTWKMVGNQLPDDPSQYLFVVVEG